MKLPCPTCSRTVQFDEIQPDGSVVCPHCATKFSSIASSDRDVLHAGDREATRVMSILRYGCMLFAILGVAYAVINLPALMWETYLWIAAMVGLGTLLYIAEQLLLIKGYLRASSD